MALKTYISYKEHLNYKIVSHLLMTIHTYQRLTLENRVNKTLNNKL